MRRCYEATMNLTSLESDRINYALLGHYASWVVLSDESISLVEAYRRVGVTMESMASRLRQSAERFQWDTVAWYTPTGEVFEEDDGSIDVKQLLEWTKNATDKTS